jgi:hypothetical protein
MHAASMDLPHVRVFRRNIMGARIEDRFVKAGIKGQCDTYAYVKGGRAIELETKSLDGTLSPQQEVWRDWCRAWGVPWLELRPLAGEAPEQTVTRWVIELRGLSEMCPHVIEDGVLCGLRYGHAGDHSP